MTFTIEESVTVERPVQEVFTFLDDDVERFASWRRPPWMELRRLTDGPVGAGSRYETSLRILGIAQGPIVTELRRAVRVRIRPRPPPRRLRTTPPPKLALNHEPEPHTGPSVTPTERTHPNIHPRRRFEQKLASSPNLEAALTDALDEVCRKASPARSVMSERSRGLRTDSYAHHLALCARNGVTEPIR